MRGGIVGVDVLHAVTRGEKKRARSWGRGCLSIPESTLAHKRAYALGVRSLNIDLELSQGSK